MHKATAAAHCLLVRHMYTSEEKRVKFMKQFDNLARPISARDIVLRGRPEELVASICSCNVSARAHATEGVSKASWSHGPIRLKASDRFPGIMTLSGSSFDVVPR